MSSFTTTSKYIQITSWLLLEYRYADNPNPETYFTNDIGFNRMVNGFRSGDVQIFNQNNDYSTTQNTAQVSVVQTSDTKFVTLDENLIIPYNDYTTELTPTSQLAVNFSPTNFSVVYDSVRFWILSGYNLSNIDGVIMQIQAQDQDLSYVTLSQILLQRASAGTYTFSPSPLTIGASIYDKYFQISIPSIPSLMSAYQAAPDGTKSQQVASKLSKSGEGFVINAPLRITAYQIGSIQVIEGYDTYFTSVINTLSLEAEDPFAEVGAYIAPSPDGQFYEYFATYDGGFIEDFILFQNSIGNAYVISHQIEVLEQIGAALIETSNFTSIQTTGYDIPNLYRPIVRNASVAVSFTLRYTMTLINNANQQRVVRISSSTSFDPHAYGTSIQPITLSNAPQVQKIYNKISTSPGIQLSSDVFGAQSLGREVIRINNVFVDNTNVTVGLTNLSVTNTGLVENPAASGSTITYYGKGLSEIDISPFDNYYKFTIVMNTPGADPKAMNFDTGGSYFLQFIDNAGKKYSVPNITNTNIANPAKGELVFKVDETSSTRILQFTDRKFYITNRPPLSQEAAQGQNTTVATASTIQDVRATSASTNNTSVNGIFGVAASSIVYWGYWKPESESSRFAVEPTPQQIVAPTGATAPPFAFAPPNVSITDPALAVSNSSLDGSNIFKTIKPVVGASGAANIVRNVTNAVTGAISNITNLSTEEKINAVTTAVQGLVLQGWTQERIVAFFLKPNELGTKLYGLTKEQFKQAVTGINVTSDTPGVLKTFDLNLIDQFGNTEAGLTNGGPAATKGKVTLTGGGNSIVNRLIGGGFKL